MEQICNYKVVLNIIAFKIRNEYRADTVRKLNKTFQELNKSFLWK